MNDPSMATDGVSRLRLWRTFAMAGVAGAALAVLLGFLFRDWLLDRWRSPEGLNDAFPPGVLADYVPEDSEALVFVDVRALRESPLGSRHLQPTVQHLLGTTQRRLRWIDLLGMSPFTDLDTLQISFAPGKGRQPLWLARGKLDRSRMQTGPDRLHETTLDGFRVWEYRVRRPDRTTLLAPLGDMLVVSESRDRVQAALKQARDPQPLQVSDPTLRELLTQVDRRQTLWLAASIKSLGPITGIDNFFLKMVLRPLLAHAESVQGGITCGEDLRVELYFRSATDKDTDRLEKDLGSICETAPAAALLPGVQKEVLPLLRLLGTGQISRKGNSLLLRCRLAADQLPD